MNSWIYPLALVLGGMTLKWVLDLIFLRRVFHETERRLSTREAEFTTLKHEHSQSLTELKNKLMELDATAKAKTLAEGNLAKQNSNLVSLRAHVLHTEEELAKCRASESLLTEQSATRESELRLARTQIESLQTEARTQADGVESLRLRLTEASAAATAQAEIAAELRAAVAGSRQEVAETTARAHAVDGELAAQRSVTETLEAAVRSRDAQIADSQSRYAALESERQSVATSLGVADRELASARVALLDATRQLQDALQAGSGHDLEIHSLRRQLESVTKARTAAEAQIKQRESEIARHEKRAGEIQQLAEATAAENQRILSELAAVRRESAEAGDHRTEWVTQLRSAEASAKEYEQRTVSAEARVQQLEGEQVKLHSEVQAVRREKTRLEAEIQALRETPPATLPLALAPEAGPDVTLRLRDLEAELEAVSASHAHLETELVRERQRAAEFEAQIRTNPSTTTSAHDPLPVQGAGGATSDAALLAEIDELNRERNQLAAELAALKSAQPPAPPPARRRKGRTTEVDLFAAEPKASAEVTGSDAVPSPADGPADGEAVREFSTKCPQHLSDVKGIGSVFETRLYEAGIGSYWELSQLSDRTLAETLELDEKQLEQFDCAATRADARRLAEETRSIGRKWTGEQPDDLEPLEGIGPAIEKRLYDAGICTFAALAVATEEQLAELCPPTKFRGANYAHWIEQARQRIATEEN